MSLVGALLAVLVVLHVEGYEIEVQSSVGRQARSSTRSTSRQKSGIRYRSEDEIVQIDPYRVVEKVREVRGDPDELKNELPALSIPGHGEQYDDCGDDVPHVCAGCGEPIEVGRTCYRAECPRCAPAWAMRAATRAGAKLEATRRYLYSIRGQSPRFHHLVFSPPEGFAVARSDPKKAAEEIVKEACDELGVDGGVILYHPWRGAEDDDRGFWKEVLFEGNEWEETLRNLEHGPHFHVIAVGRFVPGQNFTQHLHEKTGWTFKRITKGGDDSASNVSIYDLHDLARALTYSLSHVGLGDGDAYRYFGTVANLSAEDHIEEEVDAAVRSVAPNTLGLPYRSTSCARELEEDEEAATSVSTPPANPDPDRADRDDQEDEQRRCGGRVVPMSAAYRLLQDREWVEQAARVDELIEYLREDRPPPGKEI